jgi:hypothetical protein
MAKRKRLTAEEKKEVNENLRKKIKTESAYTYADQQRVVNTLSLKNIGHYFLAVFLPPVGVPLLWKKREDLHMNNASLIVWTGIGIIITVQYIRLIIQAVGA